MSNSHKTTSETDAHPPAPHNHTAASGDGGDLDAAVVDGYIVFNEESAPSTPASGTVAVYAKSDGLLYSKDDAGTETLVSGGAGGAGGATFSTLGTTSAGASFATGRGLYVKKVTLASTGLIASIAGFVKGNASNYEGIGAALFSDTTAAPINIIAVSSQFTTVDAASKVGAIGRVNTTVRALTFPIGFVATAGDYWIGIWIQNSDGSSVSLAFNSGTGSDKTQLAGGDGIADSSIAAFSGTSNDYCIYANIVR